MSREKRTAFLQAKVFPSTKVWVKKQTGNVISVSDYLFTLVERDRQQAELTSAVKQIIGGRVGKN